MLDNVPPVSNRWSSGKTLLMYRVSHLFYDGATDKEKLQRRYGNKPIPYAKRLEAGDQEEETS